MTESYKAVVYQGSDVLYVAYADDPETALEKGLFTENPSKAQVFEGPGWADQVAGLGAVLERVI